MKIGDQIKLENGRKGIVEDYDDNYYYVKDDNGNIHNIAKDEKLIASTEECLNAVENKFKELGWEIEDQGKTIIGNVHYQIKAIGENFTEEDLRIKYEELDDALGEIDEMFNCKPTCNVGLTENNEITAGVDIRKMYIPDSKAIKDEPVHMTYGELLKAIDKHNSENNVKHQFEDENPLQCVVVITADSFNKEYTVEERSYKFRSDNKAFLSGMIGSSIFADCLDGTDSGVRLDWYLYDGWKVEYAYILNE